MKEYFQSNYKNIMHEYLEEATAKKDASRLHWTKMSMFDIFLSLIRRKS